MTTRRETIARIIRERVFVDLPDLEKMVAEIDATLSSDLGVVQTRIADGGQCNEQSAQSLSDPSIFADEYERLKAVNIYEKCAAIAEAYSWSATESRMHAGAKIAAAIRIAGTQAFNADQPNPHQPHAVSVETK